jgi:hypothetical protein
MISHRYDTFYGIVGAFAITILITLTTTMDERERQAEQTVSANYSVLREASLDAVRNPQTDKELREAAAQAYCGQAAYVLTEASLTCIPKHGKQYRVTFR